VNSCSVVFPAIAQCSLKWQGCDVGGCAQPPSLPLSARPVPSVGICSLATQADSGVAPCSFPLSQGWWLRFCGEGEACWGRRWPLPLCQMLLPLPFGAVPSLASWGQRDEPRAWIGTTSSPGTALSCPAEWPWMNPAPSSNVDSTDRLGPLRIMK
jgi:hypothetical protein